MKSSGVWCKLPASFLWSVWMTNDPFTEREYLMKTPRRSMLACLLCLSLVFSTLLPSLPAWGWGAGMHAALTAHGHERMTLRWKDSLDRGLLIYGAWGPDIWYILSDDFMAYMCPVACGSDDGRISNECWGVYEDEDRYHAYTRHLLASAESLQEISWAFGYGAHAVEDWRGHMEYIIPDWEDPEGDLYDRHSFVDSTGGVLAFNVDGLYGYPSDYTLDRWAFGYANGGFLTTENHHATGERNADIGAVVKVKDNGRGKREVVWTAELSEEATGLSPDGLCRINDAASLGSASEGILASLYGETDYDSLGHEYPIVVEEGRVAINCGTNFCQRLQPAEETGFGGGIACQIGVASVSGLAQWDDFLKPADAEDETNDNIVLDQEAVQTWMDRLAGEWENGGTRLDDNAVFGINPDTGKSEKHLYGVDGRDFTFGRTMPEIVSEVLELSVQDLLIRLYENSHMVGTVLQSRLTPIDKARFSAFDFSYRPRLSAWPERLSYQGEEVVLDPPPPGPFATVDYALDMNSPAHNAAPQMVFPYYVASFTLEEDTLHGHGRLVASTHLGDGSTTKEDMELFIYDSESGFVATQETRARMTTTEDGLLHFQLVVDNTQAGAYTYATEAHGMARVIRFSLNAVDSSQPPFDWQADLRVQAYCDLPDLDALDEPATDNAACPLDEPESVEDGDEPTDGDDGNPTDEVDGDVVEGMNTPENASDDGGCCHQAQPFGFLLFMLLFGMACRRRGLLFAA